MLNETSIFSSFSVDDLEKAKAFYGETLGVNIREESDMGLRLFPAGGPGIFIYPKTDHQPATYTVLNFVVVDIDAAIDVLADGGVRFEHYGRDDLPQDEKGVLRGIHAGMGPDIAWFKDPAGNILSLLQEE